MDPAISEWNPSLYSQSQATAVAFLDSFQCRQRCCRLPSSVCGLWMWLKTALTAFVSLFWRHRLMPMRRPSASSFRSRCRGAPTCPCPSHRKACGTQEEGRRHAGQLHQLPRLPVPSMPLSHEYERRRSALAVELPPSLPSSTAWCATLSCRLAPLFIGIASNSFHVLRAVYFCLEFAARARWMVTQAPMGSMHRMLRWPWRNGCHTIVSKWWGHRRWRGSLHSIAIPRQKLGASSSVVDLIRRGFP